MMTPTVIVVRDPDASNDFTTFGDVEVLDFDLGRVDLYDHDEWVDWLVQMMAKIADLNNGEARVAADGILAGIVDRFGHGEKEEVCDS